MWDFGAGMDVTRLVLRLMRKAGGPEKVAEITTRLLPRIQSLTWRLELCDVVGHRENTGHKLVTVEASSELQRLLRDQIARAPIESLTAEPQLPYLLFFLKTGSEEDQARVSELCRDERVFLAILKSSVTKTFSQTMGDVAQRVKIRLQWKALESLIGAEALKERVLRMDPASLPADEDLRKAFALAIRYAKGELKPESFRDDED